MGLIKAALNAVTGNLADQYKEYFECNAMPSDVLACKGVKKLAKGGTNNGSDNIITDGSVIAVAEGQCALIVSDGKVAEVCSEPGRYEYKSGESPSVFCGDLGDTIMNTLKDIGSRISFGGQAGRDQRVYYINQKEVLSNKYGTVNPIPFRVVDRNIGLDIDVELRCNGEYAYQITNPVLFFTNVCGNFAEPTYKRTNIDSMLKSEILTALQPALGKISDQGIRYSSLTNHTLEICDALNEILSKKWGDKRGMIVTSFGINSATIPDDDEKMIKELQRKAVMRDPSMAAATLVEAQGEAMKTAAGNAGGAMMGFYGMNMAQQQGGFNANNLYQMGAMQQQQQMQQMQQQQAAPQAAPAPAAGTWKCSCGAENTGKFCAECGNPKPADNFWTCSCGAQNKGKFCAECGKPKPAGVPQFKCDKCGWEPEDPKNPPKFCPECGDPFDANDIV